MEEKSVHSCASDRDNTFSLFTVAQNMSSVKTCELPAFMVHLLSKESLCEGIASYFGQSCGYIWVARVWCCFQGVLLLLPAVQNITILTPSQADPHRDPHGEMRGKVERWADGKAVILKGLFFVSPRSCILRQDMLQYLPLILSASYEAVWGIYEAVTMV